MARLARGEFGRLLFGALLGGGELRLERLDMGFQRPDDLIGERPFVQNAGAQGAIVRDPNDIVPTLGRPNPRSLVVSERLLPTAALRPLPDGLGRHAQQFGRLPVGKPLARQIVPRPLRRRTPSSCRGAARTLVHRGLSAQDKADGYMTSRTTTISNAHGRAGVLFHSNHRRVGNAGGNRCHKR